MGMRELERGILHEARIVTGIKSLKVKDLLEWSTGAVKKVAGETIYYLPDVGVNIAILTPKPKGAK